MDETILDVHIQAPERLPGQPNHRTNMIADGLGSAQLKPVRLTIETPAKFETGQCLAGMPPADPTEFPKDFHRAAPGAETVMVDSHDPMRDGIGRLSARSSGQNNGQQFRVGQSFRAKFVKPLADLAVELSPAESG